MKRRSNPWPAFSDLFMMLLLLTLGFASGLSGLGSDEERPTAPKFAKLQAEIKEAMKRSHIGVEPCREVNRSRGEGDDTNSLCLELKLRFKTNLAEIAGEHRQGLQEVCEAIRRVFSADEELNPEDYEIVIEGHTDQTVPTRMDLVEKDRYLFNWDLSARRAQAVLYEFHKLCELGRPSYHVLAEGYADSRPRRKCEDASDGLGECHAENRRTTLRIRPTENPRSDPSPGATPGSPEMIEVDPSGTEKEERQDETRP